LELLCGSFEGVDFGVISPDNFFKVFDFLLLLPQDSSLLLTACVMLKNDNIRTVSEITTAVHL
jgi:hypothetical protein